MQAFDAAGIAVYALSYDEADALRDFGAAHGITYTLLSDADSKVIRSFGLLNTLIDADDHPWYGIPYPGTYVINAAGVITHKFFDSNLAVRAGPEQLLRAVQGERLAGLPASAPAGGEVQVTLELDGTTLAPTVQKDLVARFTVPAGRHVYAEPAPQGSVPVNLLLDPNDCLVQRPVVHPASEQHQLAGTEGSFPVHHDVFELRLPLTLNSAVDKNVDEVKVSGELCWQACDAEVCDVPTKRRFELLLPIARSPAVALGSKAGAALEPNAMAHFKKMSSRRE